MKSRMKATKESLSSSAVRKPGENSAAGPPGVQDSTIKRRQRGLNRSRKALPSLPADLEGVGSSRVGLETVPASPTSSPSPAAVMLGRRLSLIDSIIRRNKNQHRAQAFFKHLCLLRSSLTRLLKVYINLSDLSRTKRSISGAQQVRERFEREASLRGQKELLEEHVREVLVPKCYVTFTGLVNDTQFANLGVVLVSLLADTVAGKEGVGELRLDTAAEDDAYLVLHGNRAADASGEELGKKIERNLRASLLGTSTRMTGEDQGVVIQRTYGSDGDEMDTNVSSDVGRRDDAEEVATAQNKSPISRGDLETRPEMNKHSGEVMPIPAQFTEGRSFKAKGAAPTTLNDSREPTGNKNKKRKNAIDDLFSSLL